MPETPDQFDETTEKNDAQTRAIRELNDGFRQSLTGGRVLITSGVQALDDAIQMKIIQAVRLFENFSPDNDPYGVHDFGSVDVDGHKLMWKIDTYDKSLEYGSPNAADPAVTTRVLTIFLASEY